MGTVPTAGGFGQELRRIRTRAGLTLRSLAEQVTFDYSYLAQVERGTRTGSARLASRCDQALGAHGRLVRLHATGSRKSRRARLTAMRSRPTTPPVADQANPATEQIVGIWRGHGARLN